jgi:glycosyltransferase involved in cell wall biosynthesis
VNRKENHFQRINILYVDYISRYLTKGGAQIVLFNILRSIDRSRFNPICVALTRNYPFKDWKELGVADIRELNINDEFLDFKISRFKIILNLPAFLFSIVLAGFRMINSLKVENIHIIHPVGNIPFLISLIPAKVYSIPILFHPQNSIYGLSRFLLYGLANIFADKILFVSNSMRQEMMGSCTNDKCLVIYNGVNLNKFDFRRSSKLREELGIKDNEFLVGIIGSLLERKGHRCFLEMAKILRGKKIKFLIVGEGPELSNLRKFVQSDDLGSNVIFMGFNNNVAEVVGSLDVLVQASVVPESFGLVLIEAMAMKKPVIATGIGGTLEIIEDKISGLLVPPKDANRLAQAVLFLMENEEKRREIGENAFTRVKEHFSLERNIGRIQELYLSELKKTL